MYVNKYKVSLIILTLIYGFLSAVKVTGQFVEMKIDVFDYAQTYVEPVIMDVQIKNNGTSISNFFPMRLETHFKQSDDKEWKRFESDYINFETQNDSSKIIAFEEEQSLEDVLLVYPQTILSLLQSSMLKEDKEYFVKLVLYSYKDNFKITSNIEKIYVKKQPILTKLQFLG